MRITCPFIAATAPIRNSAIWGTRRRAGRIRSGRDAPADPTLFVDYVYMRTNPAGLLKEFWQHTGGCRAWLVVDRNVDHA